MKSVACVVVFAMAIVLVTVPATAATKVFLLGGQSNMVGAGKVADLVGPLAKYATPQTDVNFWDSATSSWVALQPGLGGNSSSFGPEVSFGYAMRNAFPTDDIYLVKYAVSGSMLADDNSNPGYASGTWQPVQAASNYVTQRNYPPFKSTANAALTDLVNKGKAPVIAGMLWMQGETDAYLYADAAAYKTNLKSLIATVRSDFNTFGAQNMEFVIGQITTSYGDAANNALVRAAQAAIPGEVANTAWFPTEDLSGWQTGGHYNAQGQIDLGQRFANVFVPEPTTSALVITCLFGVLCYTWRQQR